MFALTGILKKDEVKNFKSNDGSILKRRVVYIENKNNPFPIAVNISDLNSNIGKVGDHVILEDIMIYAHQIKDDKEKQALNKYYVSID